MQKATSYGALLLRNGGTGVHQWTMIDGIWCHVGETRPAFPLPDLVARIARRSLRVVATAMPVVSQQASNWVGWFPTERQRRRIDLSRW